MIHEREVRRVFESEAEGLQISHSNMRNEYMKIKGAFKNEYARQDVNGCERRKRRMMEGSKKRVRDGGDEGRKNSREGEWKK
jgi:hypothetical protein